MLPLACSSSDQAAIFFPWLLRSSVGSAPQNPDLAVGAGQGGDFGKSQEILLWKGLEDEGSVSRQ